MIATTQKSPLTDEMLARFAERAHAYDRDNRFFREDFDDLVASGYTKMAIPAELGGLGFTLPEVAKETRRLAYYAPATALGLNMHTYWMGLAADLYRSGDTSCVWMLEEGALGEIYAAGHSESGNDVAVLFSSSKAERVEGGYRFFGRKNFGSLTPVWTRLGIHAMDASDPAQPMVVHAFMPRGSAGFRIVETWDTLGMRATRSDDTILDGAFVPDRYIARVVPCDFAGADLFVLGIFVWAEVNFANVYLGIAQRAFDIAMDSARAKASVAMEGKTMAYNPMVVYTAAEMAVELDAVVAHVERTADDWAAGVSHGGLWPSKLVGTKYHAVEAARRVAKQALDIVGGSGIFKTHELERILRDVTLGPVHPASTLLFHEVAGKTALGTLGLPPRWG